MEDKNEEEQATPRGRPMPIPSTGGVYGKRRTSPKGQAKPVVVTAPPGPPRKRQPRQQTPDTPVSRLPRPQDDGDPGAAREELARQALGDEVIDALKEAAREGDEMGERVGNLALRVEAVEKYVSAGKDDLLIEMAKRVDAAEENVGRLSAQVDEIGKLVYSFGRELGSDSLPAEPKKKG